MRPSEETIKVLEPTLLGNIENAISDFDEWTGKVDLPIQMTNMLFSAYVAGMVNVMLPESNWNKKFKGRPK